MHCKELVKGKSWVCVADGPRNPITGRRKQVSRRGKTRKEAESRVKSALEDVDHTLDYNQKITFNNFAAEWYDLYRKRGRKETTNATRVFSIKAMSKYIGALQMKAITPKAYQHILNDLFDIGKSESTIKMVHSTARMIFGYATEISLVKQDVTSSVLIPQKRLTVEEIENDEVLEKYLEVSELQEFLKETDRYKSFVFVVAIYLIAFTGMRPGELAALTDSDIWYDTSQISITKTVYRKRRVIHEFKLTPPKTITSIRVIDVDKKIMDMIKELGDYKKRNNFKPSIHIFTTKNGFPITVEQLRQAVMRIGEKTTIQKKLYTYMLRHTHISMLAEVGESLPLIMKRVGHKNSDTTTQIYTHVTKGMREQTIERMSSKYGDLMEFGRNPK